MARRRDLIELGLEALTALANPGFVKRAQKDLALGAVPTLCQDADGTVRALFDDGVQTFIGPAATLRDAVCSCPASSMCRHRVTLVLAYQVWPDLEPVAALGSGGDRLLVETADVGEWSPAQFDDAAIAATVGPGVLEQARKLALAHPIATVLAGASSADGMTTPSVRLPMSHVRFFSRSSLAHARCDCQQGSACAHVVLAIWAFRLAHQTHPGVAEVTLAVLPGGRLSAETRTAGALQAPDAMALINDLQDCLWSLWRDGSSAPLLALEARFEVLRARLQQQAWTWVAGELDTVWLKLQAQERRSSRFDVQDLVDAMTRLWARLQGAVHAERDPGARIPASQILGIGQKGEVALDHLRLVSLGAQFWRDTVQSGASLIFADPDTQTVSVLERCWPRPADPADPSDGLLNRRIAGLSLKLLAGGQVVTKAAKRRANACIELGATARQTSVMPLSPKSWDDLRPPLKFAQVAALAQYLRERPPPSVRPGQVGDSWHVLELSDLTLEDWAWDAAQQTLFASWQSVESTVLRVYLPHQHLTPGAIDALARALNGEWGALHCIAGPVWLEQGSVAMRPMSLLTQQRAVVLALEPPAPQRLSLREMILPTSANQTLLRETQYLIGQLLRQGIHHTHPAQRTRFIAQAAQLADAGYLQMATLLRQVFAERSVSTGQRATGVAPLSMLCLLLQGLLA